MTKLLHLVASPKKDLSGSRRIATAFIDRYRERHPADELVELELFDASLPRFGADHAIAKFAPIYGEERTAGQAAAWLDIEALVHAFDSADKVLLSCPMWNYSVPWALKLYIDCLMQPGLTFGYDRDRMVHIGLLRNRPVQFILTRSSIMPGDYGDFQLPYLRYIFSSMGLNDIRVLSAWQTTQPTRAARAAYIERFLAEASAAAEAF